MSTDPPDLDHALATKIHQLEALIDFGRALAGVSEASEVAHRLGLTLAGQLLVRAWGVVATRDGRVPVVVEKRMPSLTTTDALADLAALRTWSVPQRFAAAADHLRSQLSQVLTAAEVGAVIPLISGDTTFGFIVLGPRADHRDYSDDELTHAFGLAGQAVVAFEGAWQAEEASHWRRLTTAREEWGQLDRLSRLVFLAVARVGFDQIAVDEAVHSRLNGAVDGRGIDAEQFEASIARLCDRGALSRGEDGTLRIEKQEWLLLPEARKPLAEVARESQERIGAFRIIEKIGSGGMGEVYRAINVHDGSAAAIKLLFAQESESDEHRRRFGREIEIIASLAHPGIVRFLESGDHGGRLYLAMELLDGEPLTRVARRGGMSVVTAVTAAAEIAGALGALHERGVIHRDVKGSNIMLLPSGKVVLLDFGLARGVVASTLTNLGRVVGTLPYIAPELLRRSHEISPAVDVWALGIVLYEMLFARLPWHGATTVELAVEIVAGPKLDKEMAKTLGEQLLRLLHDLLAVDRAKRIPDGKVAERRLRRVLSTLTPQEGWPVGRVVDDPASETGVTTLNSRALDLGHASTRSRPDDLRQQ